MLQLARTFFIPLTSLVLLIMGSGLLSTFVSIRLEWEGFGTETIGLVSSALYLGVLIGSFCLDRWIAKIGHIRAFSIFAILSSLCILAQIFWIAPFYWSMLRLVGGVCMAGIFIVIESWLLIQTPSEMRGSVLSLYLAIFYLALSAGQFLINLSDIESNSFFYLAAGLFFFSIFPFSLCKVQEPVLESSPRLNLIELIRFSPLGFLGGIISGMLLAIIYGLVPVYAKEIGLGISDIGTLMGVIIFGGLSFQWPFGKWADKKDRRHVLIVTSFITALLGVAIGFFEMPFWLLLILSWFFGGCSFTLYPISMAYTCEKVPNNQIIAATGGFVLSYGIGAVAGPLFAPIAMSFLYPQGLFYFLSAIMFIFCLFSLKSWWKDSTPAEN